ncbi:MAG: hypothetical protein JWR37_6016 [Mycobacterium sp.]|nr:hypothetical protein [Mycobacterium sp.]
MKVPAIAAAGLAAGTLLALGVSLAGCSSDKSTPPTAAGSATSTTSGPPPTSAPAKTADYRGLLIKDTEISAPGQTFTASAPTFNPNGQEGVAVVFANADGTEQIGDTILILPDASAAAAALEGSKAALSNAVVGGTPAPSAVGTGGTVVSGTSPDGSKSVTVLLFTQGRAFATLEFDGAPHDPVPPEGVIDVGQKQDAAITKGLPA